MLTWDHALLLLFGAAVLVSQGINLAYARMILRQQMFLLSRRPRVDSQARRRITQLLLETRLFDRVEQRHILLRDLPSNLLAHLAAATNTPAVDVAQLVDACARWSSAAWVTFLENALDVLDGSAAADELQRVAGRWLS